LAPDRANLSSIGMAQRTQRESFEWMVLDRLGLINGAIEGYSRCSATVEAA